MLTFLFWNLGGAVTSSLRLARLRDSLQRLTASYTVDVLLLAECPLESADLLPALNRSSPPRFQEPDPASQCERVVLYPRFSRRFLRIRSESATYTCRELRLPARERLLLVAAHLKSKLHSSDESQAQALPGLSSMIRLQEERLEHDRTVVIGDLNMNPFETGLVSAEGLNAVMTRGIASAGSRKVDAVSYPYFYNPMWSHFGDSTHDVHPPGSPDHEPPGTCYYRQSESRWFFWNMFDQVLIRPSLLPAFRSRHVKILTGDGFASFITAAGLPDSRNFSDHLPILFRLEL
jgi:hypothetical protein